VRCGAVLDLVELRLFAHASKLGARTRLDIIDGNFNKKKNKKENMGYAKNIA
jgi:hypothetical protein